MSWQKDLEAGQSEFLAGQFKKAETTLSGALENIKKDNSGSGDHARVLELLARTHGWLGKYKKADQELIEARRILAEQHGASSKEVAINDLYRSENCLHLENFDEAYTLAANALKVLESKVPHNDLALAHGLERVGAAAFYLNRADEAQPYLSKALGIRSVKLPENDRIIGETLNLLSACYAAAENYTMAGAIGRKALKILEEKLGKDHPEVGLVLYNLATQYVRTGMFERGELVARRGLDIFNASLPEIHPLTVRMSERLASACLANCQFEESEQLQISALRSAERLWDQNSLNLVSPLIGLGSSYLYKADWQNAEVYFKRSLSILEKAPELNTGLEYQLLRQLSCCYIFQLKIADAMHLLPATFRAKHTSDATSTIDLINKLIGFVSKKIEHAAKGES